MSSLSMGSCSLFRSEFEDRCRLITITQGKAAHLFQPVLSFRQNFADVSLLFIAQPAAVFAKNFFGFCIYFGASSGGKLLRGAWLGLRGCHALSPDFVL